jgi:hypothetical protein
MAKFNSGELGGVYYKAIPTGFRRFLRIDKISPIPYILGYDIHTILLIKLKHGNWWTEGVLKPNLPRYFNFPFEITVPNKKGKWVDKLPVGHPIKPTVFSCELQLQNVQETDNPLHPIVESVETKLIEDIRVISLSTFLAWVIPILVAITGIIISILLFN